MLNTPDHVQLIHKDIPSPWVLNLCSGCLLDQKRSLGQVEFTQPMRVGLGLAVGLNPNTSTQCLQDNTQMCMQQSRRHQKTCGTLVTYSGNIMWESQKMQEHENHVNNMQMQQTDELW